MWSDVLLAVVLATAAGGFSLVLGQVGRILPTSRRPRLATPLHVPLADVVAAPGVRREALAYLLGPLLAGSAATLAGIGHPYWAAVSATVPLIGTTLAAQIARGTLRFLGTLGGIAVAAALLVPPLPIWALLLAIAVLQFITELFVTRNYGIAVIAITPIALILTHLGAPAPLGSLFSDRMLETVIGAVASILVLAVSAAVRRRGRSGYQR